MALSHTCVNSISAASHPSPPFGTPDDLGPLLIATLLFFQLATWGFESDSSCGRSSPRDVDLPKARSQICPSTSSDIWSDGTLPGNLSLVFLVKRCTPPPILPKPPLLCYMKGIFCKDKKSPSAQVSTTSLFVHLSAPWSPLSVKNIRNYTVIWAVLVWSHSPSNVLLFCDEDIPCSRSAYRHKFSCLKPQTWMWYIHLRKFRTLHFTQPDDDHSHARSKFVPDWIASSGSTLVPETTRHGRRQSFCQIGPGNNLLTSGRIRWSLYLYYKYLFNVGSYM